MKRIKKVLLLSFTLLLVGCTAEPDFKDSLNRQIPINVYGRVNQLTTKATDSGFEDKDALGLYAVNYTDHNTVVGELLAEGNQADNAKYVFDASDVKWTPTRPVYYKDIETSVDLYLYYPWQNTISDVNAFNFEVARDQSTQRKNATPGGYEASDFLWGKAPSVYPTENSVSVTLNHKMAGCTVTLVEGSGFEAGEWASVEMSIIMNNTTRKCSIDLSTGVISPIGEAQSTGIVMLPTVNDSFKCVIVPQSVAANKELFAITIDRVAYSYKDSNVSTFEAGKMTTYTITVNKRQPSGDYELELTGISINPWVEDRNPVQIEARQYYVVNVDTPGTLGQLIEAAGKNPAKIKNLKVTGNVNADDFYFMRDQMEILEAVNMKECVLTDDKIPDNALSGKRTLCYYVYPDYVREIGSEAFSGSSLSGAQILPNGLERIGASAFSGTIITSLSMPSSLHEIQQQAFYGCSTLTGDLILPDGIEVLTYECFRGCSFSGLLHLPENLKTIEAEVFYGAGSFVGDLVIPDNVTSIGTVAFGGFSGRLFLNGKLQTIEYAAFNWCSFKGKLDLPEGLVELGGGNFSRSAFSSIYFPSTLRVIGGDEFCGNAITELYINDGCISIGADAFSHNAALTSVRLPSSLQTIGRSAFANCYALSSIICEAVVPPNTFSGVFDGVGKDNLTIEVPANSVSLYNSAPAWGEFKRISAHYDFSISRRLIRSLNQGKTRLFTLRAPSGYDWSIQSKPDWVTVSPSSGTGRTEVTITIQEMPRTSTPMYDLDDINNQIGVGRNGEIIFLLDEKDYTSTMTIEQYDYDYSDGQLLQLQGATKGNGIDIFITGDGYDAADIAGGKFYDNANAAYGYFFGLEPYITYKDYFNVYSIVAESDETGIETPNTVVNTKFGTRLTRNRIDFQEQDACFSLVQNTKPSADIMKALVILLMNTSIYEGVTYMYGNGSAIACCPISTDLYPYDFRGIVQHEAGGHGFGKLLDEYIYHNDWITTCTCPCCEHPHSEYDTSTSYGIYKQHGWGKNLSMYSDPHQVPWAHLIFNSQYSDYVDIYEGGYMHTRGIYRSEPISCMNNNIPYYSAISRQAIVERIMEYAGEEFTLEKFYAKDNNSFGTKASSARPDWGDYPSRHTEANMPVYMGEHPNL